MEPKLSRRSFIRTAAVAAAAQRLALAQGISAQVRPAPLSDGKSVVALVHGDDRRKNICESLVAIEDQILPVLRSKKYVVIKPNLVSTVKQLAATHADALRGILDFLAPRFKGPIIIAESSAGDTLQGYDNFGYQRVVDDFKPRQVSLLDLNDEARYETIQVVNADLHPVQVRLASRLLDPDAYIICSAVLKTHNVTVATLSVKNMTLGAPLHNSRKETKRWNDKRHYHGGVRQTHFDMLLTAQKMRPFWGVTVIDGFEGMEGNGPSAGTPVPSRIAIASTDYLSADRVGVEAMGINPEWLAYLKYCAQAGLGQYDLSGIDIRGAKLADVRKQYQLHPDIERELQWMGPMTEIPPKLG
jgi:uncharacterized protein (DUF362 family)